MGTGPYMLGPYMVGPWVLVHICMGTGPYMVGPWVLVHGYWSMGTGPWVLAHGSMSIHGRYCTSFSSFQLMHMYHSVCVCELILWYEMHLNSWQPLKILPQTSVLFLVFS